MVIAKMLMSGVLAALATAAIADEAVMTTSTMEEALAQGEEASAPASFVADGQWQQIAQDIRYIIPRGRTYSPVVDFSANPVTATQLRAQLFALPRDTCWANLEAINVAHSPNQTELTRYPVDASGIVTLTQKTVYRVVFNFVQNDIRNSHCTLRLSATLAEPTPPVEFELAGALSYQGGFRHRMNIALNKDIAQFWLRIPAHCTGIEVLEAGTIQNGSFVPARLVDPAQHLYQVGATRSYQTESLSVSFNGPAGQTCDIPVYVLPNVAN